MLLSYCEVQIWGYLPAPRYEKSLPEEKKKTCIRIYHKENRRQGIIFAGGIKSFKPPCGAGGRGDEQMMVVDVTIVIWTNKFVKLNKSTEHIRRNI